MTTQDETTYATMVDFGDGVPALETGETKTTANNTPTTYPTAKTNQNKAFCAFGLVLTVLGQVLLATALAVGGDPLVGTVCTVGLAGFGLGFAVRIRKIEGDPSPLGEYEWLGGAGTEFFLSPREGTALPISPFTTALQPPNPHKTSNHCLALV